MTITAYPNSRLPLVLLWTIVCIAVLLWTMDHGLWTAACGALRSNGNTLTVHNL